MKYLFAFCISFMSIASAKSQASLAAEDIIDDVVVTTASGVNVIYTLVRDAFQKDQWYYMPATARLYEIKPVGSSELEPEFNMVKYQYNNPASPGSLLEGGVIQFSITMAPDATSLEQLRARITKATNNPNVRLAALPLKSATVHLVTPKGDFLVEGSQVEGIAPTQSNAKMVFSIALTKMGTDVYDALTTSNTGMGVSVKFTFNGVTPPAGFNIKVNWDETYKYYSRNEKKMASFSTAWKWIGGSASYQSEKQKIVSELRSTKAIDVQMITNEVVTDEKLLKFIDPILERINKELFETAAFGRSMDSFLTAQSMLIDTGRPLNGKGEAFVAFLKANAHMSVAIKDVNMVRKGEETVVMTIKNVVERNSVTGGFVGLGAYSETVRNKLQIRIANGQWTSAYFVLPYVSDDSAIGVKQVGMEVRLTHKGTFHSGQAFNWSKEKGWTDRNGTVRTVAAFPLMELASKDPGMKDTRFEIKASIGWGNSVLDLLQAMPAGNMENNITLPISMVDIIKVNPDFLAFKKLDPTSPLTYVTIGLTKGAQTITGNIAPKNLNGAFVSPKPFYWLIAKNENPQVPVTANIVFTLADGKKVNWKYNGMSLTSPGLSHEIMLQDSDYQTPQ